jgi:hypothetical protein
MANFTTNLGLKKPLGAESFNVEDQNGNMDKIDAVATKIGATAPTTATVGTVGEFYFDTVACVFYKCTTVAGSVYTWKFLVEEPIGIIKQYVGTDLGSDWGLCNGSPFPASTYPSLANLPIFGHDLRVNNIITMTKENGGGSNPFWNYTIGHAQINLNGYDIVCGTYFNGSTYTPAIGYISHDSTDGFNNVSIGSDSNFYVTDIIWNGTYYVAVAYDGAAPSGLAKLYYSTTLSNTAWTSYAITLLQGGAIPYSQIAAPIFIYKNGYYVIATRYFGGNGNTHSCYIMYSQNLTSGWVSTRLAGSVGSAELGGLYYINNTWVIIHYYSTGLYVSSCTTSAPTSFSAMTNINTGSASSASMQFKNMKYVDGKWVILTGTTSATTYFFYNTSATFTTTGWQYSLIAGLTDGVIPRDFDFDGKVWAIKGQDNSNTTYYIWVSATTAITSVFARISIISRLIQLSIPIPTYSNVAQYINRLDYNDIEKRWTIIMSCNNSSYLCTLNRYLCGTILPLITLDKSYTYIRLK